MDIPLEIAFHNAEPSAEIDALIRKHVGRLEKLYPHLIGCRVLKPATFDAYAARATAWSWPYRR